MIYGSRKELTTIQLLEAHQSYTFYPTGSRYFGTNTEESDYDYFVQDGENVRAWLIGAGFVEDFHSYEGDPVIVRVYKKDNIHVQAVKSAVAKWRIQDRIADILHITGNVCNKLKMRRLWIVATRLYRDGMSAEQFGVPAEF